MSMTLGGLLLIKKSYPAFRDICIIEVKFSLFAKLEQPIEGINSCEFILLFDPLAIPDGPAMFAPSIVDASLACNLILEAL